MVFRIRNQHQQPGKIATLNRLFWLRFLGRARGVLVDSSDLQASPPSSRFTFQKDKAVGSDSGLFSAPAFLSGAHGFDQFATFASSCTRLQSNHTSLLQAKILRQLSIFGLGRLDHRPQRLLRQLLPRRLRRSASNSGHFPQLPHARPGRVSPDGLVPRPAAVLCTDQILQHVAHLLRTRHEHHQARSAQNGRR